MGCQHAGSAPEQLRSFYTSLTVFDTYEPWCVCDIQTTGCDKQPRLLSCVESWSWMLASALGSIAHSVFSTTNFSLPLHITRSRAA